MTRRSCALGLASVAVGARTALAEHRMVRLVVPAAPGGAIDVIGRLYAQRVSELLAQSWYVENKPGASNTLGAAEVATAKPDGATLLTNADVHIMARHVMRHASYDPIADFVPISRLATSPVVLVGHPKQAAADLPELIAQMKAQPDRFTFANSGLGGMGHLATESFKRRAGAATVIVNYRGTAPALTDLLAGQVSLMMAPLGSTLPYIRDGSLRAIAIMSAERNANLPAVPTAIEQGLNGFEFVLWYGLWGPKGLAADEVQRINGAVQTASRQPELADKLTALGAQPVTETASTFAAFIKAEAQRAARIFAEAGIKPA